MTCYVAYPKMAKSRHPKKVYNYFVQDVFGRTFRHNLTDREKLSTYYFSLYNNIC